jgi:probable F420-dependent oxidoreductase
MKTWMMTGGQPLARFGDLARQAADAGFAGLVVTESGRTAYLSCAAAALSGADVDLATGVAVAFPRSPMVTASAAWELAEVTGGRFRLGLGTQVRAHIERRYASTFDPPGPRLREYVEAVKAVFAAFRGEPLAFHGKYWDLSLLPAMWSPGPIAVADPPVDVAAVNPWMLRMAAEVADGVHVHPLNTPTYYQETLLPNVRPRAGKPFALFVPVFTVAGDTEAERRRTRESCRTMVAFYGSTPNYGFLFEQLGFAGTTDAIRAAQKAGDVAGMSGIVTDDILAHFVVEGTWAELPDRLAARLAPLASAGFDVHAVLYLAGAAAVNDPDAFARYGGLAAAMADH